ncbi:MAG: endolytic transglycosylase MltG [Candidatus Aminicenantes bacterium]|nr:endolytic transglycosylase MltG [Candidatus Aminicenantes bacterium]
MIPSILKIAKKILVLAVFVLLFFLSWFSSVFTSPKKGMEAETVFEVQKGESARDIAQNLRERGMIRREWAFILGYKLFFAPRSLKAGEYAFRFPCSTKNVLEQITNGEVILHPVTVPEGLTRLETAEQIQSQTGITRESFLLSSEETSLIEDLDTQAGDLEGYLYPETYNFVKGFGARDLVVAMVSQFREVFSTQWQNTAVDLGLTIRDVVILASLIEKETSVAAERSLVSAVFHNRLKRGMKLDCDPTIIYVLKQEGRFKDRLRSKDLQLDSPYNTYLYSGLPPGPIANPGKESLWAALNPAKVDYLYFVSKNDGSHHFSPTFREHQNAVLKYQKNK